ncbi:MAG: RDD family protein [Caldilineaceae bacterium]
MNMLPGPLELMVLLFLIGTILVVWFLRREPAKVVAKTFVDEKSRLLSDVSSGHRLTNWIIDNVLIALIYIVSIGQQSVFSVEEKQGLACLIIFMYYFIFEATLQKTPGKFVTRTKVVSSRIMDYWESDQPVLGAIAWRTIVRFVPFEPLSGWWHDRWSETRVVRDR